MNRSLRMYFFLNWGVFFLVMLFIYFCLTSLFATEYLCDTTQAAVKPQVDDFVAFSKLTLEQKIKLIDKDLSNIYWWYSSEYPHIVTPVYDAYVDYKQILQNLPADPSIKHAYLNSVYKEVHTACLKARELFYAPVPWTVILLQVIIIGGTIGLWTWTITPYLPPGK